MKEAISGEGPAGARYCSTVPSSVIQTGFQRYERPVYDYPTKFPPCRAHCPAGHDIAWALYLAAMERYDLAHRTFLEDSPFPAITGRVCYHPCEGACNRGAYDQPVAIQALERACAEWGGESPETPPPRLYPETVGIIGAGPAGLTCAYHLVKLGYGVTVYEAQSRPGGVLAWGIPPYRLPRPVLQREMERLQKMGVQFCLNTRIGRDLSFSEVQSRHQALFLGLGLSRPRSLPIPLPEHPRILAGIDFLRQVSLPANGAGKGPDPFSGKVVVVGGGDVAIDAARSARRLGAPEVGLYCLESRPEMPAHPEEVEAALSEGIQLRERVALQGVEVNRDSLLLHLASVREVRRGTGGEVAYTLDPELRLASVSADSLIYAIGQQPDLAGLPEWLQEGPVVAVDALGQTACPGVFAGGDLIGVYNVVNAIGSAKRAAIGIDVFLRGWSREGLEEQIRVGPQGALSMASYQAWRSGQSPPRMERAVTVEDINLSYFPRRPRLRRPALEPAARVQSFAEVNGTLSAESSTAEAQRCFNCGICNRCGNCFLYCPDSSVVPLADWDFAIDLDHCKGCGICVEECPRHAMSMVPEREVADHEAAVG